MNLKAGWWVLTTTARRLDFQCSTCIPQSFLFTGMDQSDDDNDYEDDDDDDDSPYFNLKWNG